MFCRRRRYYRCLQEGDINIEEVKEKIKQGAILLDVRSKQEYAEGHINGAINVPEHEIIKNIETLIPKKNQQIVIYCQSGSRSKKAYAEMKNIGYTNIYNLVGGLDMI